MQPLSDHEDHSHSSSRSPNQIHVWLPSLSSTNTSIGSSNSASVERDPDVSKALRERSDPTAITVWVESLRRIENGARADNHLLLRTQRRSNSARARHASPGRSSDSSATSSGVRNRLRSATPTGQAAPLLTNATNGTSPRSSPRVSRSSISSAFASLWNTLNVSHPRALPSGSAAHAVSPLVTQIHRQTCGLVSTEKLQDLDREGVLEMIPRNVDGEFTSVGSIFHVRNECSPCAYWFKGICKYSVSCTYCHFKHEGQKNKRLRPSKQVRMRMRRWTDQKKKQYLEDRDEDEDRRDEDDSDTKVDAQHDDQCHAMLYVSNGMPVTSNLEPVLDGCIEHL